MLDEIVDDVANYLCRMDDYFVAHRLVKTRIFGDCITHAYVTLSRSGAYRLFFSTVDPMALHMSIAWQENKALHNTSSKHMAIYPLKLYKLRWGIETNYYGQKMFWEFGNYKVRTKTTIEHLLNLTNAGHALMKNPAVRGRDAELLPGQEPARAAVHAEPADPQGSIFHYFGV